VILENPEKYGFKVTEEEKYPVLKCRQVILSGSVSNLAEYAHNQGINYKMLKYLNPWLKQSYLKNPAKKKLSPQNS
jgi:membrane-bound lytic murein transglycosylase D